MLRTLPEKRIIANLDITDPQPVVRSKSRSWMLSPIGRRLLRDERQALEDLVRRLHGDTLLWCGEHMASLSCLQRSIVRHRFLLGDQTQSPPEGVIPLVARPDRLPFANNSMDGVVLHHALEPLADPRDALREITRVLHPGGRLVIAAFNPWSLLGMRRLYARFGRDAFSGVRFVNPVRLLDWLRLLGLELEEPVRFRSSGLPFEVRWPRRTVSSGRTDDDPDPEQDFFFRAARRRHGIEIPLGDVFLITAVKQAYYLRPRTAGVRTAQVKLAGVAYPKTSARVLPVDFRGERR